MHKFLLTVLLTTTVVASPSGAGSGQKKQPQCEHSPQTVRNWELIDRDYIYFDFVLCPAGTGSNPFVRVWITTRGNGYAVERWAQDRDGADAVTMFQKERQAFTLYRDLGAVPLTLFRAERRSAVPAEMGRQPFLLEGTLLLPIEKLTPESVERVKNVFKDADVLIKKSQQKVPLLHESRRVAAVADSLDKILKARK